MYHRMMILVFIACAFPGTGFAGTEGYVEVEVEYSSLFPGVIQIKDEVCRPARAVECEKAAIRLQSGSCTGKKDRCPEENEILQSSFCIPGLIYEGQAAQGDTIRVAVCASGGGYGNLSARDIRNNRTWSNYPLLSNGNRVKYP